MKERSTPLLALVYLRIARDIFFDEEKPALGRRFDKLIKTLEEEIEQ